MAHGTDRLPRALRGLPGNAGNDLHGIGDTFCAAHLLFGGQRNFLNQLGRLAHHGRDRFERLARLIGQARAYFYFLGAFFHDDYRFVGLRLNGLDECGNIFRGAAGMFRQLAHFVGNHREAAAGLARARRFDGRVQSQQVGLLGDVVNHVDDFGDFQ